ncbi:shikimate kinase AroL [Oceanidesulfovibrio marinus]|uniref:Shikimate kinase n=2 Tax=Oceanidesulfovibrio marinus TaxID=370038 RepID=A0ABX6NDN4_9BACT|nr:shikimate kinase AroL [Oceanidesulfovibrio marinus]
MNLEISQHAPLALRRCGAFLLLGIARTMLHERVFLIGLRASGKSSLGKLLAEHMSAAFVDADVVAVDCLSCPISDLVEREGWPAFRELETTILDEIATRPGPLVIATGGGVVLDPANRERMREAGIVVYIEASAEVLADRLCSDLQPGQRPSLTGCSPVEEVAQVLAERESLYKDTAHIVVNGEMPLDQLAADLAARLEADPQQEGVDS